LNTGNSEIKARTFEARGNLRWPWLEVESVQADFEGESKALASGKSGFGKTRVLRWPVCPERQTWSNTGCRRATLTMHCRPLASSRDRSAAWLTVVVWRSPGLPALRFGLCGFKRIGPGESTIFSRGGSPADHHQQRAQRARGAGNRRDGNKGRSQSPYFDQPRRGGFWIWNRQRRFP